VIGPLSLYGLAVTVDAYPQLRDDDRDGFDGDPAATDSPSVTV
jgi:hypothetical protein